MTFAPGTQVIAYLSFHLEVDGATSVHSGHDIVDAAEHA
jgi:divalent metal cation (Fe/Co/Zn/Cd) transporter